MYIGDKVVLTPVNAGQPLHVSDLSLLDHPECREVNADPAGTSWKICLFMECREDKNDVLKGVSRGWGVWGGSTDWRGHFRLECENVADLVIVSRLLAYFHKPQ